MSFLCVPRDVRPARLLSGLLAVWASAVVAVPASEGPVRWRHLSSVRGELPVPGRSTQQTGVVVGDFDADGRNDFIIACRQVAPALIGYHRVDAGWERIVIEQDFLTVEAGGATHDIDQDGDLDLVFGGDWQSDEVWWWENPAPDFDPAVSWRRHLIKRGGAHQHHDQTSADFLGTGRSQLAFWNQQANTLFLAEIPEDPRAADHWPLTPIFTGKVSGRIPYAEGMSVADVDQDGRPDLLAGSFWFKHIGGRRFQATEIGVPGGLIFAAQFIEGGPLEVVISPGDGVGPLKWYFCGGDPTKSASWHGHQLVERDLIHGHSLQVGDINGDGHPDIFAAEMAKWGRQAKPDHPDATAWIFYGDGRGHFERTVLVKGHGWHEARLADLDGDGDLDLLNKPYTWETPRVDVWLNEGSAQ